jgi:hypothetical protein
MFRCRVGRVKGEWSWERVAKRRECVARRFDGRVIGWREERQRIVRCGG